MRTPRPAAALALTVGLTAGLAGCEQSAVVPGGSASTSSTSSPPAGLDVAIPAYVPPQDDAYWQAVVGATPAVRQVILNPDNGPGAEEAAGYRHLVADLRQAGIRVFGYVRTGAGNRSPDAVTADVAHWQQWYGVPDIFFDEASSRAAKLSLYRRYVGGVHDDGGVAVLNPGVVPDRGYFAFADAVVTFEDTAGRYVSRSREPAWLRAEPAAKVWQIVIGAPRSHLDEVLSRARTDGAGAVYVTDDDVPNPYDRLPSYWPAEVAAAAR